MNNLVITFSGKGHSGKDTCADFMAECFFKKNENVFRLAFADYLKALCKRNFSYDDNDKETGREILQMFGTDVVRAKDDRFWVQTTFNTIDVLREIYDVFLITDARFDNELQPYPWNMGYPIINIYVNRDSDGLKDGLKNHSSESMANNPDLSKFHYIINNNGTIDELYNSCEKLVNEIIDARDKYIEELLKKV